MVWMMGFNSGERGLILALVEQFSADGHRLEELVGIERADMPGYNGRVVPRPAAAGGGFDVTMYLACCAPFTIAHELAHISDIRERRDETHDHLSRRMPASWHLAHRMSSEYTANRLACGHVGEDAVFAAFTTDRLGLLAAWKRGDWASALVGYALVLGLFHGLGRHDCDPLRLLPEGATLPTKVTEGVAAFRDTAAAGYAATWGKR